MPNLVKGSTLRLFKGVRTRGPLLNALQSTLKTHTVATLTRNMLFLKRNLITNLLIALGGELPCMLTVADVDSCIKNLKKGKAAGCDGLTAEHIIHSHPLLVVHLTMLFNSFFKPGPGAIGFYQGYNLSHS